MDWEHTSCCKCLLLAAKGDEGASEIVLWKHWHGHTLLYYFVLWQALSHVWLNINANRAGDGIISRRLGLILAMIFFTRAPRNYNFVQAVSAVELWRQGCSHKLFQTLNRLVVTQCFQTAGNHVDRIANDHDGCLLWKTSVEVSFPESFSSIWWKEIATCYQYSKRLSMYDFFLQTLNDIRKRPCAGYQGRAITATVFAGTTYKLILIVSIRAKRGKPNFFFGPYPSHIKTEYQHSIWKMPLPFLPANLFHISCHNPKTTKNWGTRWCFL